MPLQKWRKSEFSNKNRCHYFLMCFLLNRHKVHKHREKIMVLRKLNRANKNKISKVFFVENNRLATVKFGKKIVQ